MTTATPRILVIRLSAFGDFILSLGLFERIRTHHPHAHITLMTTHPYKEMGADCGYFDEVRTIARWRAVALGPWLRYIKNVWRQPFDMVYDLQSNDRTKALRLLSPPAMRRYWQSAGGPTPDGMLSIDVHAGKPPSNIDWLARAANDFNLTTPYILLVPGSAPQHPAKRWPAQHYAALARMIVDDGKTPVILGTSAEASVAADIAAAVPQAVNLAGQTSIADIAGLGLRASGAVGNDTGPMHLISFTGCPVVSLFSAASDPVYSAPRGPIVRVLRRNDLADLPPDDVAAEMDEILR